MTSLLATLAFANARSVELDRQRATRHEAAVARRTESLRKTNAERAANKARKHRQQIALLLKREQPTTQRVADWLGISAQAARDLMLRAERDGLVTHEREGRPHIWKAT